MYSDVLVLADDNGVRVFYGDDVRLPTRPFLFGERPLANSN